MTITMTITRILRVALALFLAVAITDVSALAQRGRANVRSSSRSTVNTHNTASNVNRNTNVNRNVDVNQNVNRNIDVDRDIDVDVDYDACCYRGGWGTAAAVATTAAVTAAVVGSMVYALPPSCTMVIVNGLSYQQCGNVWYQPQLTGSSTTYLVVNPPQ
jgi:hypothetical protein